MSFGSSYLTLPEFQYLKPKSLQEAMQILDEHKDEAKILAGGIGLLAFMKERLVDPRWVVDIKAIDELHALRDEGAKGLTIGATSTMNQLLAFEPLKEKYKALRDCISLLSDPVIRNRSTLLGDVCEALPYVDGPTPLLLFDAEIEAASVKGRRRIPMSEFIKGVAETALEPNEIADRDPRQVPTRTLKEPIPETHIEQRVQRRKHGSLVRKSHHTREQDGEVRLRSNICDSSESPRS